MLYAPTMDALVSHPYATLVVRKNGLCEFINDTAHQWREGSFSASNPSFFDLCPSYQEDNVTTPEAFLQLLEEVAGKGVVQRPWRIVDTQLKEHQVMLTAMAHPTSTDIVHLHWTAPTEENTQVNGDNIYALRSLLNSTHHEIWAVDRSYRLIQFNRAWEQAFASFFDVELEAGLCLVEDQRLPVSIRKSWKERYDAAFQGKEVHVEEKYVGPNGELKHVATSVLPMRDANGNIEGATCFVEDISLLIETHAKKQEHQELYRLLAEHTSDLVAILDLEGHFVYVSPSVFKLTGYTPEEYQQLTTTDNVHRDDHVLLDQAIQQLIAGKKSLTLEYRIFHKDGSEIWIETKCVRGTLNGRPDPVVVTSSIDISERKRQQEEIEKRQERLRFLARATTEMLRLNKEDEVYRFITLKLKELYGEKVGIITSAFYVDEGIYETKALYVQNRYLNLLHRLFQFPLVGIKGKIIPSTIEPLRSGRLVDLQLTITELSESSIPRNITKAIEQILPPHFIWTIGLKEGDHLLGNIHILFFDPDYDLNRLMVETLVGEAATLVAKFRYNEQLHSTENRFSGVVNALTDAIFTLDKKLRHTGLYGTWVERMGFQPQELLGKTPEEVFSSMDGRLHTEMAKKALLGKEMDYVWQTTLNGQYIEMHIKLTPLRDKEGVITGLLGVGRDITEIMGYKRYIEDQNEKLKRIAWIQSHDVRGPLTRLQGLVNLLENGGFRPEKSEAEMLQLIRQSSDELDEIIKDIIHRAQSIT